LTWMYICLVSYNDQEMLTVSLKERLNLHWAHKIFLCGGIIFIGAGVTGISCMWKQEWLTVQLSLEATAPFLQFGAVGALTLLISRYFIGVTFAVVSIAIFLCPLCIRSPCFIEKHELPDRPKLIGHRGAPMLAPENTMMSFTRSISCGVTAFETDVQLSKDRVPFLMHDHNSNFLLRTTNAKETFPDKDLSKSNSLTWAEYQSLNAGEWFIQADPFRTVSQLSKEEETLARNQTIPSLLQLLHLAQQHNISVMFDLYSPNQKMTLLIQWPPSWKVYVRTRAPGFTQFRISNYNSHGQFVLLLVSDRKLRENNFEVNLWVVNERWLFSLLWCAGASSVTTNACHLLKDVKSPDWIMPPKQYQTIWLTVDMGSVLIMAGLFIYQW
uniref:Glycerophosphodiester phosphodiesterase domain containing 2 n=1 Tax=Neogobius melanostomus TaxID=47308 RepID=A0A8C6SJD2_9GOBI